MKKRIYLLVLLAMGIAGLYFTGSIPKVPMGELIRRGQGHSPGLELNARGVDELNNGNPAGAVTALREAMRLDPENSVITRNLSIALARDAGEIPDDDEAAVRLYQESLRLWPANPEGLDGISTFHFREGRYKEALDYALVLQEMMPDRVDLAEYIGHIRQRIADERGMSSERGDSFRLLYSDEKRLEYSGEILAVLQEQLDSLTVSLGIFPDKPIDVLLLTDDLGERATPQDPSLEGIYDGQVRLYVGEGIDDRERLIRTVRHEMVHALLHQSAGNLPGWVQEGLAQKSGEEPDEEYLMALRKYVADQIRDGYRVDLSRMGSSFIDLDEQLRTRSYATSLLFMDYLSREYGIGFIPNFVSELTSGVLPQDALRNLTGRSFEQLQESFSEDLEGKY